MTQNQREAVNDLESDDPCGCEHEDHNGDPCGGKSILGKSYCAKCLGLGHCEKFRFDPEI